MEIRDQLLRALERQRDIQQSILRQSRNVVNSQKKTQEHMHQEKLNTFAALKQTLLRNRSNTKFFGPEQINNLVVMKKNLGLQEREVKASGIALERLVTQGQQLVAQHAQINEQRRIIRECSVLQCARTLYYGEERVSEEQGVYSSIRADIEKDENALIQPTQGIESGSTLSLPVPDTFDAHCGLYVVSEERSIAQQQNFSEQRTSYQEQGAYEQALAIDSDNSSNHDRHHTFDQETDPQISFNVSDNQGKQIAVALTLRPLRGIEVNVHHNQAHALVQSKHEARRIERSLQQAGLEVADVTVNEIGADRDGYVQLFREDNIHIKTLY